MSASGNNTVGVASHPDDKVKDVPYIFTSLRYDPLLRDFEDPLKQKTKSASSHGRNNPWYNSPLYHCRFHQERLIQAAQKLDLKECLRRPCLKSPESFEIYILGAYGRYLETSDNHAISSDTPLKIRFVMTEPGTGKSTSTEDIIKISFDPTPATSLDLLYPTSLTLTPIQRQSLKPHYTVVLDYLPTEITLYTTIKTERRAMYTAARERMDTLLAALHTENIKTASTITSDATEIILFNPAGQITEGSVTSVYFYRDGRWITPPVGMEYGGLAGTARRWALEMGICEERVVTRDSVKEGEEVWLSNGVRGFLPGVVLWARGEPGTNGSGEQDE
ncbi:hypothetical protein BT63DRAFT_409896 [Microthyrium microscopicum]|uniref:Aminodeoxychorismate lyase n=1 Tax=Microthyrium microscopicum TaxID=703497 RepID=A0A6A6UP12_9PEZI|nr:hypothetical protein BT63DRAFT_409896 [Microthyrium microscopicum]